jgi:hypothetical protein
VFSEFPAVWGGRDVKGVRLRFCDGRIVDASAETEQDFLIATLDADEGARRLGELGIGCNPAITRYMRNTHFDEKMDGTVHLAVGHGLRRPGRHQRVGSPLGHGQGPAPGRQHRGERYDRSAGRRVGGVALVVEPFL